MHTLLLDTLILDTCPSLLHICTTRNLNLGWCTIPRLRGKDITTAWLLSYSVELQRKPELESWNSRSFSVRTHKKERKKEQKEIKRKQRTIKSTRKAMGHLKSRLSVHSICDHTLHARARNQYHHATWTKFFNKMLGAWTIDAIKDHLIEASHAIKYRPVLSICFSWGNKPTI